MAHIKFVKHYFREQELIGRYFDAQLDECEEVSPYILSDNVTEEQWARFCSYVEKTGDKSLPHFKHLIYEQPKVLLAELSGPVHSSVVLQFTELLKLNSGNGRPIAEWGAALMTMLDHRKIAGDDLYGPRVGTPHCYHVADERNVHATFALEIGRAQSWRLLEQKAAKWANVPGIQIILLLKVSAKIRCFGYKLYYVRQLSVLPAPAVEKVNLPIVGNDILPAENVVIDSRILLDIRRDRPLPAGMVPAVIINLREVMVNAAQYLPSWLR